MSHIRTTPWYSRPEVSGTSRDPYVRRQSAQLRRAELVAQRLELDQVISTLDARIQDCDAEIERLPTEPPPSYAPQSDEQAPSVTLAAGEL